MEFINNLTVNITLLLRCSDLPDSMLNAETIKSYFQQFGNIARIRNRFKSKSCTIEYADEESAQVAFAGSGEFNGQDFIVSWSKTRRQVYDFIFIMVMS